MLHPPRSAFAAIASALLMGGCVTAEAGGARGDPRALSVGSCATEEVVIDFNFAGASPARCVIEGVRTFSLLITPEHLPPINPSPWFAFRYKATSNGPVAIRLAYLGAEHRYRPKLTRGGTVEELPVNIAADRRSATVTVPPGSGIVSGQPLLGAAHYDEFAKGLTKEFSGRTIEIGRSLDDRAINAMRFGNEDAPRLIVVLGRQHPPEVTGAFALEPFLKELVRQMQQSSSLRTNYQILAVPLLNPDGVERGHWRANRGGIDLNRDWGQFTQPETRAVRDWLIGHAANTAPAVMVDFHSTGRNLFYVQGDEASEFNRRFLQAWLEGKEAVFPNYNFTIEKRNANPGSGTAKNWFFECFAIPSYTYEVGDNADRTETMAAARRLASDFVLSLPVLNFDRSSSPNPVNNSCAG